MDTKFYQTIDQPNQRPYWPYLIPCCTIVIINFLTTWTWSFTNLFIASIFGGMGLDIRQFPKVSRPKNQIIKFSCNKDMSKLYMRVYYTQLSRHLFTKYPQNYKTLQDWDKFTERQQSTKLVMIGSQEIDGKIIYVNFQDRFINIFELDASKTLFKLSNNKKSIISDHEALYPTIDNKKTQVFNSIYRYLIVRTQFFTSNETQHCHFYIDLQRNEDLKYQDYLFALGAHYKIQLDSEIK